jgi:hypothetical protein
MIAFILGFFTNFIGVVLVSIIPVFILLSIKEAIKSYLWKKGYRVYNKEELRKMNGIQNINKDNTVIELNKGMYKNSNDIEVSYKKTGG